MAFPLIARILLTYPGNITAKSCLDIRYDADSKEVAYHHENTSTNLGLDWISTSMPEKFGTTSHDAVIRAIVWVSEGNCRDILEVELSPNFDQQTMSSIAEFLRATFPEAEVS